MGTERGGWGCIDCHLLYGISSSFPQSLNLGEYPSSAKTFYFMTMFNTFLTTGHVNRYYMDVASFVIAVSIGHFPFLLYFHRNSCKQTVYI